MTTKCSNNYNEKSWLDKNLSGLSHFLTEKSIHTSVHPIWILVLSIVSCYITKNPMERILIVAFAFYSVLLEMINSSIELTNDRFGCEYNENTKIAKDMSGLVTALSRMPLLLICCVIFYRNIIGCNQLTMCK